MPYKSAREYAEDLKAGRISSVELVDAAISRIEALDDRLNAVVVRDFDRARDYARAADEAIARGENRPLLGVPMTVKESFNVAGLPTTRGLEGTQTIPVYEDAIAVQRLKQAGAVILGKTNVPVRLSDWQSYNDIYGTTNNPWDVTRSPGGSSGGSAAALAAGYVSLEIGTDIGGSLRIPAHFCGVYAHKPTHDIIPLRGHSPFGADTLSINPYVDLSVAGPMARNAADLMLGLDILAGPDEAQATAYRLELPPQRHSALKDYRVLVLDSHPQIPTSEETREHMNAFADKLAKAGCHVGRSSPDLPDLATAGTAYLKLLMASFSGDMSDEFYASALTRAAGIKPDATDPDSALAYGTIMNHREWLIADKVRWETAHKCRLLFRDWDIIVCPVTPTEAFPHDQGRMSTRILQVDDVALPYMQQCLWISLATLTGNPATTMPIGMSEARLPVGAQFIGPCLEDRTTIGFAGLVEQAFGGFTPPPGFMN